MSRRKARETALQALFQLDFNKMGKEAAMEAVLEESGNAGGAGYMRLLVEGVLEYLAEIDQIIAEHSHDWKVERMAGVDRNIVRIAVYEMKFSQEEITPNIVINEAVELAKTFGSDKSPRFINGILDAISKKE